MSHLYQQTYISPVGDLEIHFNEQAICQISFLHPNKAEKLKESLVAQTNLPPAADRLLSHTTKQLDEYFANVRQDFDLPLNPSGTLFQKKVWEALTKVPYGETRTYKEIAIAIGNEKACRAVGMANHNNPIAIIIPCHRVIGSDGSLTGYAGGLHIKQALLDLETLHAK